MTQQRDVTSQEPGAGQPGAGSDVPSSGPGQPRLSLDQPSSGPAQPSSSLDQLSSGQGQPSRDAGQPGRELGSAPEPVWPSPYLSEGAGIPEAYPAPPQPGQPRYGAPGGSPTPARPGSVGQQGYAPSGYGQPGTGQPGYGQSQQFPRPAGRPSTGGQVTRRDPALAAAWERLLAMTVDWILILSTAFVAALSPMLKLMHQLQSISMSQTLSETAKQTAFSNLLQSSATTSTLARFWLIAFAIALAYFWALAAAWGGTLGKQVLGLRVVAAADRSRITIGAAGVRTAAFLAGPAIFVLVPDVGLLGGLIWLADCMVMLLNSQMQCLHDRAAKTTVVRKRWLDQQARATQSSPW